MTPATDAVAAIISRFDSVQTSEVPVVAGFGAASVPSSLDATAGTAPALTRRELRERERAAEARGRVTTTVAPAGEEPVVAAASPSTEVAVAQTVVASPSVGRAARAVLFDAVETDAADAAATVLTRRAARAATIAAADARTDADGSVVGGAEKPARIRARKGIKSRSLRLAKSTHPAGKPTVAAALTASPGVAKTKAQGVKRTILQNLVSVGAMAGVGLILISTTVPANAFSRPDTALEAQTTTSASSSVSSGKTQELEVAAVAAPTVTRDGFTVTTLQQQLASREGNRLMTYVNDAAGSVQWPFPSGAPITSGFGSRSVSGCGFCSTYHEGLDFTPGIGTPIHAIADGVVSDVQTSGAFGNHVMVDHIVNGQKVQSLYAHMQYGSIKVAVGQTIAVGQEIGNVGSTGASTGPHLHLEIHLDGTPVDPFAWLQANAN